MLAQVQTNQLSDIVACNISSPPFFSPLQPALLPEPASRARDTQKATCSVGFSNLYTASGDRTQTSQPRVWRARAAWGLWRHLKHVKGIKRYNNRSFSAR